MVRSRQLASHLPESLWSTLPQRILSLALRSSGFLVRGPAQTAKCSATASGRDTQPVPDTFDKGERVRSVSPLQRATHSWQFLSGVHSTAYTSQRAKAQLSSLSGDLALGHAT